MHKLKETNPYIPKGGVQLQSLFTEDIFHFQKDQDLSRKILLYPFLTIGQDIKNLELIDENDPYNYQLQEVAFRLKESGSKHYREGYYNEGYTLLKKFKEIKTAKKSKKRLKIRTNKELASIFSTFLFLHTAFLNVENKNNRCKDGTVTGFLQDTSNYNYNIESNHIKNLVGNCACDSIEKRSGKKISASSQEGLNACVNSCGKSESTPCAEMKLLLQESTDNIINTLQSIMFIDYKNIDFCFCKNCDLLLREKQLPLAMNLSNPERIYFNKNSQFFNKVFQNIQEIYLNSKIELL